MVSMKRLPILAVLGLVSCAEVPQTPSPTLLRVEAPIELTTSIQADWPATNWWEHYHDATLTTLIEQALQISPTLAITEARLNQAKKMIQITAAQQGLQVNAYADVARQRLSDNGMIPPKFLGFHWYDQADLGIRASYRFDWWDKERSALTAATNDAYVAQAERNEAALQISSAIAMAYIGWQGDQAQISYTQEQLSLVEQRKHILQTRVDAELDSADGLYTLDLERATLGEFLLSMKTSSELRRILMASLLGISVEKLPQLFVHKLPQAGCQLPTNVSVDLLARRADIDARQWQVKAAQQRLRVARAEFMPDITVNALAGFSSIDIEKLLKANSAVPSIGLAVHLPIFDADQLRAQFGVRAAELETTIRMYNATVVDAATDVANQAMKMQRLSELQEERKAQVEAATQLLMLAKQRKEQGLIDIRSTLQAEQNVQQQQAALNAATTEALIAEIEMTAALGGGYYRDVNTTNVALKMTPIL